MATGETSSSAMEAKIWGQLQSYIDLKIIYAKLPFREFFQLRLLCKEWNRLASDRTFLEESFKDPIPKPYFVMTAFSPEQHGLLSYEASSRLWNFTRLPSRWDGFFENAGFLLCNSCEVFNVHTRCYYTLPPASELTSKLPYLGMIVDSSVSPHSFQIILGSDDFHTQKYDSGSNSWTTTLSTRTYHDRTENGPTFSCVCCSGIVYLMSTADGRGEVLIETYDVEKDEWGTLRPPGPDYCYVTYLGAWQGSLYFLKREFSDSLGNHVVVYVLVNRSEQEWEVYDRMPQELYLWVTEADEYPLVAYYDVLIRFCHEYVLVYIETGLDDRWLPGRCALLRLDTKAWEKIELSELELAAS